MHGTNLAFVFLNIDRFDINDSFGHESMITLSVIAKRLKDVLQGEHIIGRLSGDEFALSTKKYT